MGLTKEAREVEKYYQNHPEKLILKDKQKEIQKEIDKELDKLREKGIIINVIK